VHHPASPPNHHIQALTSKINGVPTKSFCGHSFWWNYTMNNARAIGNAKHVHEKWLIEEAADLGMLFVSTPPMYHDPISVSLPFCVSIAALGPTFDTEERKAPK
jgi:L-rhamnose isomerase